MENIRTHRLLAPLVAAAMLGTAPGCELEVEPNRDSLVPASSIHGTVVEDANLVTSQGPGTAFEFALALVARLCGPAEADALRKPMLLDEPRS